jgi:hypothetical protein
MTIKLQRIEFLNVDHTCVPPENLAVRTRLHPFIRFEMNVFGFIASIPLPYDSDAQCSMWASIFISLAVPRMRSLPFES